MKTAPVRPKRIVALIVLLIFSAVVLFVVRWRSQLSPPEPPSTATTSERMRIYKARIKADPTDTRAYIELGKLEESQELYISSLRRLYAARTLGGPEKEILLPLGRSLSHLARWDDAEKEMKSALALLPDNVEAVANLAGVYYSSGDSAEATKVLREFVRTHRAADNTLPLSLDDLHRLMFCFSEAKDTQGAAEIAKEILRVDPKDSGAYSIAGHALLIEERYQEALPYLEKAVSLEPNEASLCYNYGIALEHCGREDEALKQMQRCVILNPDATDGFVELASLYEKRKDWKLAAIALSNAGLHSKTNYFVLYKAAKMNERAGNLPAANYWYSTGALAAGKYAEALTYSQKLIQNPDPKWHNSGLLNAADAYRSLHKLKEYLETIQQTAKNDTAQDNLRLADAYEKADLLEKQVEYLRRALSKEPKLAPLVHYTIAQNFLRRGLRDEAEKEMEQAVAEEPNNADYHTQLGNIYFERRLNGDRLKKALVEFQQAARLEPREASSFQNLGIAYSAAEDYGHAAFYLEHAIDLQPGYGPSYQELGRVYAKVGDKDGSEQMFALYHKYVQYDLRMKTLTARADQNKNDASAQVELADLLARTGDLASALQRYQMALQLKPREPSIQMKYDRVLEVLTHKKTTQTAQH